MNWSLRDMFFFFKDDKSTWTKIESTSSDMVTRFVSIKGEKTDAKDGFRDLPVRRESNEKPSLKTNFSRSFFEIVSSMTREI